MDPDHALDRRRDLAIAVLLIVGLSLTILAAATALRMLSADWSAACHRLVHAPTIRPFGPPWRLSIPRWEARCPGLRP